MHVFKLKNNLAFYVIEILLSIMFHSRHLHIFQRHLQHIFRETFHLFYRSLPPGDSSVQSKEGRATTAPRQDKYAQYLRMVKHVENFAKRHNAEKDPNLKKISDILSKSLSGSGNEATSSHSSVTASTTSSKSEHNQPSPKNFSEDRNVAANELTKELETFVMERKSEDEMEEGLADISEILQSFR